MRIYEIAVTENNKATFQQRFPVSKLDDLKRSLGSYIFSCQYHLNPVPPEDQVFLPEWIHYWEELPDFLKICICLDPATARRKKTNDYTAFTVHGWDDKQNWYILDIYRDRLERSRMLTTLLTLHRKWQQVSQNKIPVLIETIGFQLDIKTQLERYQGEKRYFFPIEEMGGGLFSNTAKEDRIRGLQPFFERGEVYLPKSIVRYSHTKHAQSNMVEEFLNEYSFFPRAVHDDLLDSCSFPLFWSRFRNIRAEKRKNVQDTSNPLMMCNIKNQIAEVSDLRAIPGNARFTDEQLQRYVASFN